MPGSVVLKTHLPLLYKGPEKNHPAVEHFPPFELSPIDFSTLSTTTTPPPPPPPHSNILRSKVMIQKGHKIGMQKGSGGEGTLWIIVPFVCFARMKTSNTQKEEWGFEIGDGVNLDNIKSSQLLTNLNHITSHLHNTKKIFIFFSLPPSILNHHCRISFPLLKKLILFYHPPHLHTTHQPPTSIPTNLPSNHQTIKPTTNESKKKKFQFSLQLHQKKQKKEGNKAAATPPPQHNSSSTRYRTIRTAHPFFPNASSSTGIKSCFDYSTTQVQASFYPSSLPPWQLSSSSSASSFHPFWPLLSGLKNTSIPFSI